MNITQVQWKPVFKAAMHQYKQDDVPGLGAEMAYHFIFALFPFIIFLASLTGFMGSMIGSDKLFDQIMGQLYAVLPPQTVEALQGPLDAVLKQQRGGALSIGALLALWSASNGVSTIMKAFNRAYGVEETRGYLAQKGLALLLTLVESVLLITGVSLLLVGGYLGDWTAHTMGLGSLYTIGWNALRIMGSLVGISLGLALLYWKGPNVKQQFQWISPGSAAATLAWALATVAFGLYVSFMGASSYSKTYGTAFGLILFLLYLYLTSTVIVMGAELNAEAAKHPNDRGEMRDEP